MYNGVDPLQLTVNIEDSAPLLKKKEDPVPVTKVRVGDADPKNRGLF